MPPKAKNRPQPRVSKEKCVREGRAGGECRAGLTARRFAPVLMGQEACVYGIDFIQDLAVIFLAAATAGWVCRRLGLSVIAGYLAAGMLVGPRTLLWPLVSNADEIIALAQIGLVFLMFSIGLRLSVRRMRSLGGLPFVATACTALIMFCLARLLGVALGWNGTESLFL